MPTMIMIMFKLPDQYQKRLQDSTVRCLFSGVKPFMNHMTIASKLYTCMYLRRGTIFFMGVFPTLLNGEG